MEEANSVLAWPLRISGIVVIVLGTVFIERLLRKKPQRGRRGGKVSE